MKNIFITLSLILVVSCSNPEADLELQINESVDAKNYEETIKLSNQLLEINLNFFIKHYIVLDLT